MAILPYIWQSCKEDAHLVRGHIFKTIFLIILFSTWAFAFPLGNICFTPPVDKAERAMGKIVVPEEGEGSGYFPRTDWYLTVFHLIEKMPPISRTQIEGAKSVKLIRVSKIYDLALFAVEREGKNYLKHISTTPPAEAPLCTMVFVAEELERVQKTYPTAYGDNYTYEFASNKSSNFNPVSGGVTLNEKGEVAGIVTRKRSNILINVTPMIIASFLRGEIGHPCKENSSLGDCIAEEVANFNSSMASPYLSYLRFLRYAQEHGKAKALANPRVVSFLERSAQGGIVKAQYLLGQTLQSARGGYYLAQEKICSTPPIDLNCLVDLAEKYGHAKLQYYLGEIYLVGYHGVEPQKDLAREYFALSAQQGYSPAQSVLEIFSLMDPSEP